MIERWIVIGGCPRSGTTLVGNALGAAEGAVVTPEAQFAGEAFAALAAGTLAPDPQAIIAFVTGHWRYRIWKEPIPENWPDFDDCKTGAAVCSRVIGHIVSDYARRHGREGARVWIDHTPEHLRIILTLAAADFALSGVHLIRDGRGVAASMKKVDWGPRDAAALANWWNARIAEGFAAERALGPAGTNIRYEDILTDPEKAFRQLCAALGITYSDSMLTSRALQVIDYTKAQHKFVGLSPNPVRAAAWKDSLSKREQEIFESIAGPALGLLGYERLFATPRPQSLAERIGTFVRNNPVRRRLTKRRRKNHRAAWLHNA